MRYVEFCGVSVRRTALYKWRQTDIVWDYSHSSRYTLCLHWLSKVGSAPDNVNHTHYSRS